MSDDDILALARTRLGRVLRGKYHLDRVLGVGGMAAVYAATHRNKKRFAIKMLHPELSLRETIRTRFLREGYVANSVEHPGAVAVLDDDVAEDGAAFVVMELLEGSAVDELWEKHGKHLPLPLVLSIGDALLDVLAAAHAKGIVHRDIKPANLFLTNDGRLRVLDFGIARLHDATSASATQSGAMLGTPAYMAPEQALAESHNVDAQSDLWAVGATLFTLLTGELVHVGETAGHFLVNAATKKAREISGVAEVPTRVAAVIDKALAFDKKDRWADAKEMREALAQACVEETGAPIAPLPKTETVTGFEATIASDSSTASGSGAKPSARSVRAPARASWRWRVGAGVVVVAGVTLGVLASRGAFRGAALPTAPSAAPLSIPRAGRPPATTAAAAAYDAALQAQRDGNTPEMRRSLEAAVASDPALAAAYLRLALYWSTVGADADAHSAFQKAEVHRATLGEVDAALLEASEPLFRDPRDGAESTRRLQEVTKKYPQDVVLETMLALSFLQSNRQGDADVALDRALALDRRYVPALALKSWTAYRDGDSARASQLLDECVRASPAAIRCFAQRMDISNDDGRCAELKADARRVIAIDPASEEGYHMLAHAMLALGEPVESVAEALRRSDADIPDPDRRRLGELRTLATLALLQGDLRGAEQADADGLAFALSRPSLDASELAIAQIGAVLEEGDTAHARVLIRAMRARIGASGTGEPNIGDEGQLAAFELRAGAITREGFRAEEEHVMAYQEEIDAHQGGKMEPFVVWGGIYAVDVEEEATAAEALAALQNVGGEDRAAAAVDPVYAGRLGSVYAFAGRGAEATPTLSAIPS